MAASLIFCCCVVHNDAALLVWASLVPLIVAPRPRLERPQLSGTFLIKGETWQ